MSNSPTEDVEDVLARLGIRDRFDLVMPAAAKPRGLAGLLDGLGSAERILCIGDNYVNDIEPALRAGGAALYIDRYESNLGTDSTACTRLPSIDAVLIRLGAQ
jgi:FMN phosphatase YigB (HAD superfamily)